MMQRMNVPGANIEPWSLTSIDLMKKRRMVIHDQICTLLKKQKQNSKQVTAKK